MACHYVDTMPQYITSTGPVLQCRPRWHSVGIGQRAKLKFPHGRVPRTPSPVFPLPALPAKVFRSACLPAQPASLSSRPSVLRKLFVVPCGMCHFSSSVLRLFGNGLLRRFPPYFVEYLLSRDRRAVPLFLYETSTYERERETLLKRRMNCIKWYEWYGTNDKT